jgi:flagellar hook-associated protein 1 FlgK
MSTGFINTAMTGIQAAQLNLATTAHNTVNAGTEGYTRQRAVQASNTATLTGAGYVGQGVHVASIERYYDRFLSAEVNSTQTKVSELESYYAQIKKIDNSLSDANSGISTALANFFSGVNSVAANPSLNSSRQTMNSSAQSLVSRYQALNDQLKQLYDGVNGSITSTVASINSYTKQIGELNADIIVAQSSTQQPANDLLDQRDQLVSELNKLIAVTTTTNSDGSFNVFVGTGQQLVVGTLVSTMTAAPAADDPTRIVVGLKTGAGSQELPESLVTGGSLGGLLNFRSESLDSAANELGREAVSLALTFNAQHQLGQDLQGNAGVDYFTLTKPTVIGSSTNATGSPAVSVSYTAPAYNGNFYTDLTGSDYRLTYNVGMLTLTRLSDNAQWSGVDVTAVNTQLAADPQGFTLDNVSFTGAAAGTTYLIEPTRNAISGLGLNSAVIADNRLIAAAAPMRTEASGTNSGKATISAGSVSTGYKELAAGTPLTLTYNSAANTLSWPAITAKDGTTIPAGSIGYSSGATITIAGNNFAISGSPNTGDTFVISKNSSGTTDARNAALLGKLQTQNTMAGQTASYQTAYAALVSNIGNKTREISTTGDAQQALLNQATAARDAVSGVNTDEEAANLIVFQEAYQASAKVIEVASKLFDTLLAIN